VAEPEDALVGEWSRERLLQMNSAFAAAMAQAMQERTSRNVRAKKMRLEVEQPAPERSEDGS
jgi:hypothetical protein